MPKKNAQVSHLISPHFISLFEKRFGYGQNFSHIDDNWTLEKQIFQTLPSKKLQMLFCKLTCWLGENSVFGCFDDLPGLLLGCYQQLVNVMPESTFA